MYAWRKYFLYRRVYQSAREPLFISPHLLSYYHSQPCTQIAKVGNTFPASFFRRYIVRSASQSGFPYGEYDTALHRHLTCKTVVS